MSWMELASFKIIFRNLKCGFWFCTKMKEGGGVRDHTKGIDPDNLYKNSIFVISRQVLFYKMVGLIYHLQVRLTLDDTFSVH